jgi:hypothetical protein
MKSVGTGETGTSVNSDELQGITANLRESPLIPGNPGNPWELGNPGSFRESRQDVLSQAFPGNFSRLRVKPAFG